MLLPETPPSGPAVITPPLPGPRHGSTITCCTLAAGGWNPAAEFCVPRTPHVYRFSVAQFLPHFPYLASLLAPGEIRRGQQYFREADRQQHLVARAVLRLVLGKITRVSPRTISFATGLHHKPLLAEPAGLHFSVSYAGSLVLLAVHGSSVGIDVEAADPEFAYQPLLSQCFSSAESRHITEATCPATAFFQLWTRKEALAKATAQGIDQHFARLPALDGAHEPGPGVLASEQSWRVISFPAAAHCPASLAYPASPAGQPPLFYDLNEHLLD
ncbi:4'-phosphopantetheinyl transferase superfamily protein [Hymenobacter sp. NST-14]|uniref:4'-phosphopantetheinyl transferase family protein n=1 Tax=Hymenobacter piscis TaxID=2839984 RepID=UPI001C02960C|nr:4'-phosphopantetheinyl transferase superfamily protein [Hymenobacter piscis]MBT9393364.1 4'-phosphopantetheinyl transferase superfamily protein [Hymenobacter piscis]